MDTTPEGPDPDLETLRLAGVPPLQLLQEAAASLRDVDEHLATLGQRLADAAQAVAIQADLIPAPDAGPLDHASANKR